MLKVLPPSADCAHGRGTAIKPDASADLLLPRSAPPRPRRGAQFPDTGRFSPLTAPQRAAVDAFLSEAHPWAMRQARRAYRHLPAELHEQGYEQAALALRTGAPSSLDRRALYAELARHLDDELRRIHVGWCLNRAQATATEIVEAPDAQRPLAAFLEHGLGGLERAVLQLELGAGRDTATVRAALRLGPRQYARHRELGLGKLRGAIAGGLRSRVCDQHLESVTLAATGDRAAADRLASGPDRCRACAREASGLRRVLQQRLALAPWPLAIKPAGILAAKLGAVGALAGGKSAAGSVTGTGLIGSGSGAKVVAALVATAAVASGGIAAVESPPAPAPDPVAAAAPAPATASGSGPAVASTGATTTRERPAAARRAAAKRRKATRERRRREGAATPPATAQPQAPQASGGTPAITAPKPAETIRRTVDGVKKTVDEVTGKLPVRVPKVDELAPGVTDAVDGVTGALDGLLTP